jgi:predicted metal-dependent phosphoesterase TrpH
MKRTIPEIRERLRELATEHGLPELRQLAEETIRRPAVRRAPTRNKTPTPELAERIRNYARRHPRAHQQDIAQHFGVNAGRVSEALNRKPASHAGNDPKKL